MATDEPAEELTVADVSRLIDDLTLIEVKTAQAIRNKALAGFFFGSWETPYYLSEAARDRILWAFVVLNDDGRPIFTLLTFDQVDEKTRTPRP